MSKCEQCRWNTETHIDNICDKCIHGKADHFEEKLKPREGWIYTDIAGNHTADSDLERLKMRLTALHIDYLSEGKITKFKEVINDRII
jgi:hypothetical protein